VDLLARRADLSAIAETLHRVGLVQIEVLGVTMFIDRRRPTPKGGVHLVIAGEKVRPHYTHPAPDLDRAVRGVAAYPVVDLPTLVTMKLQSYRPIDQAHLIDLKSVGLLDQGLLRKVPRDLRDRLRAILRTAE